MKTKPTGKSSAKKAQPTAMKSPTKKVSKETAAGNEKNAKALSYGPASTFPRYYGCVTLYNDVGGSLWRVKPGVGRRDHKMFSYKVDPRSVWMSLVKHVKTITDK